MTLSRSPTFAEVLNTLRAGIFKDLRVACTGRVTSYNGDLHEVDVQPIPADTYEDATGTSRELKLPVVVGVPYGGIEGGGCHVRVTPSVGDYVTLVFADRSLDAFLAGRSEGAPADQRSHALTDAIAYPLFVSGARPTGLQAGTVSLGANTGSDDFAALAAKTKAALDAVVSFINGHTHILTLSSGTGTAAPPTPALSTPTAVASSSVKIRG